MSGLKFQRIWLSTIANKRIKTGFHEERCQTVYPKSKFTHSDLLVSFFNTTIVALA
jgi:hypothetical protein